jgi:dUTP pyrophosphatase
MRIKLDSGAVMPTYATEGSAGLDLCANEDATIPAVGWKLVRTGVHFEIPSGFVGLLFPRSGNALKRGLTFENCVGVIDSDYRGDVGAEIRNDMYCPQTVRRGEKIAQMVFVECRQFPLEMVDELGNTERGDGGFGSTGR